MTTLRSFATSVVATAWVGSLFALLDLWLMALRNRDVVDGATFYEVGKLYLVTSAVLAVMGLLLRARMPTTSRIRNLAAPQLTAVFVAFGLAFLLAIAAFNSNAPVPFMSPLAIAGDLVIAGIAIAGVPAVSPRIAGMRPAQRLRLLVVPSTLLIGLVLVAGRPVSSGLSGVADDPAPSTGLSDASRPPNLLLILIDTLRADHVSSYGYARDTTPHLDRLSERGTRFARTYAQSSWTRPTVATIFTSLYPSQHGTNRLGARLPDDATTLAEYLLDHGYSTLGASANPVVSPQFGYDQGFNELFLPSRDTLLASSLLVRLYRRFSPEMLAAIVARGRRDEDPGIFKTDDEEITDWGERALDGGLQEPFFLYLHYLGPHARYEAPAPYGDRYQPGISPRSPDSPGSPGVLRGRRPLTASPRPPATIFDAAESLSAADLASLVASYDAEIHYTDALVGRLLAAIERNGLAERTVVAATSDHGEAFFDHANWGHGGSLHDELLRVPLIIAYPPAIAAGRVVSARARGIDLFPTFAGLLGLAPPPNVFGADLSHLAALDSTAHDARAPEYVYSELVSGAYQSRALIVGPHKYIESSHRGRRLRQLFALRADAGEQINLLDNDPTAAGPLVEMLATLQARLAEERLDAMSVDIDENTRQRLRALGYVQ